MPLKSFRGLMNPSFRQVNEGQPTLQPGQALTPGYYSGGQAAAPGSGSVSFTTPGTYSWTVGSGVTRVYLDAVGAGGGGGGGASATYTGGGGGAGGEVILILKVTPGETWTITIGAGGTGGGVGVNGNAGGNTVIQSSAGWTAYAYGGNGGSAGTSSANGAGGSGGGVSVVGLPALSIPQIVGQTNTAGQAGTSSSGGNGAQLQLWGLLQSANTGTFTVSGIAAGGTSSSPNGANGPNYGAGGGGGYVNGSGGAGSCGSVQLAW